ncbi:MAG: RsmD family RNA methyltransferase [bacterium]
MIRLTGGDRKGMSLHAPRGRQTRPATAQVRQWIFDVLGPPRGLDVLDLFAGTGSVGLEALSRGAERVTFVEPWRPAMDALLRNLAKTGFTDRSEVLTMDAARAAASLRDQDRTFHLCFCDPPYAWEGLEALLSESVLDLLTAEGTLVVEHRGDPPLAPRGRPPEREKEFGDTVLSLWYGRGAGKEK